MTTHANAVAIGSFKFCEVLFFLFFLNSGPIAETPNAWWNQADR